MTKAKTKQRDEVRGILAQLSQSGLSQREFAIQEGVPVSTLAYWIRRERLERQLAGETALVAVTTSTEERVEPFVLEVEGVRIEVPRDTTDSEWRNLRAAWVS